MDETILQLNALTSKVISCAMKVHTALGPGLLESSYKGCMLYEMREDGIFVESEKPIALIYKGAHMGTGYRADMMIERKLILELKAVDQITDIPLAQVLTYLKNSQTRLGLLINFNVVHLKQGIRRVIL